MAGKKVRNEVEGIRSELQGLAEAVWALREHVTIQSAAAAASTSGAPIRALAAPDIAGDIAPSGDRRGTIVARGVVRDSSGTREYRWDYDAPLESVLAIDDESTARMLAAIGHRQRLAILKMILDTPSTAADLVNTLDLGTTGAAYHHLNVLQSADLVTQEGRGVFVVQPHRVSAIFTILAGIQSAAHTSVAETTADDVPAGDPEADDSQGSKRKKRKAA